MNKWLFAFSSLLLPFLSAAQVSLGYYDLPSRGHSYYQKVIESLPGSRIPESVYDTTDQEHYWDLSEISGVTTNDTLNYYWVEGTSAEFDFPDANMADVPANGGSEAAYFIKNETGFYFSGQSGGFNTDIGDLDISAEFRPAVPILKVPAKQGDVVEEVSRASVDILTLGEVKLTTDMRYEVNGYGTVKIPGGEEFLAMRIKRVNVTTIEYSVELIPGQELSDTTTTTETTYEFYTPGYGDAVANVTVSFEENLGLEQHSFIYRDGRNVSSIEEGSEKTPVLQVMHVTEKGLVLLKGTDMIGGNYELIASNGQSVKQWTGSNNTETLHTQTLKRGLYVLRATNAQGFSSTHKILIP